MSVKVENILVERYCDAYQSLLCSEEYSRALALNQHLIEVSIDVSDLTGMYGITSFQFTHNLETESDRLSLYVNEKFLNYDLTDVLGLKIFLKVDDITDTSNFSYLCNVNSMIVLLNHDTLFKIKDLYIKDMTRMNAVILLSKSLKSLHNYFDIDTLTIGIKYYRPRTYKSFFANGFTLETLIQEDSRFRFNTMCILLYYTNFYAAYTFAMEMSQDFSFSAYHKCYKINFIQYGERNDRCEIENYKEFMRKRSLCNVSEVRINNQLVTV